MTDIIIYIQLFSYKEIPINENMKPALCLIKNEEKNYSSFIAKLPA
ncbi:hypothetical protein KQI18_06205 [Clostridioides mangenotii]|nr:hypothetical protein [Clostridioides mangenotii]MBU5307375.1 hypothetical protein [Clostridioides mangenotii]